ncbi:hypothetical protein D1007_29749 [Hordeum vulgare]|nr:hypothetical protein D1007_29749 [Hordeum vulgare]
MSERRLQLLDQVLARHEDWIAAGLPPDVLDPEEEHEDGEKKEEAEEEEGVRDAGAADLQAEQHVILDSFWSESTTKAKRRGLQEAEVEHTTDVDEMHATMEEWPKPSYAPI